MRIMRLSFLHFGFTVTGGGGVERGLSRPRRLPGLSQQRGRLPRGAAGHRERGGGSQEELFEGGDLLDGDGFLLNM